MRHNRWDRMYFYALGCIFLSSLVLLLAQMGIILPNLPKVFFCLSLTFTFFTMFMGIRHDAKHDRLELEESIRAVQEGLGPALDDFFARPKPSDNKWVN